MSVAVFKNKWEKIKVECPWCGATQIENIVTNVSSFKNIQCFYCGNDFYYNHIKCESTKIEKL
jgi:transposase-like protein